jgi:hypothetical protein
MRRRHPEQETQIALFQHLRARGQPGLIAFHPPNGGARTAVEGAILKSIGVVSGAPDVLMWYAGRSFAMELKADGGKLTETQREMLDGLAKAGVQTAVCHGIDEALGQLQAWNLLIGRMQ